MKCYSIWTGCLFQLLGKTIVAFDVRLSSNVNSLATNGRVVFATVDLNEGKGYNSSNGIFTAPALGVYVFDWTILTQLGKAAHTSLVVNGKRKSWNNCHDVGSKIHFSCSKMTVIKLKQGDKVWIGVFGEQADMFTQYTSFSGYKL